jgi:hypothetical protein
MDGVHLLEWAMSQGWYYREVRRITNQAAFNELCRLADGEVYIVGHFNTPNPARPTTGLVLSPAAHNKLKAIFDEQRAKRNPPDAGDSGGTAGSAHAPDRPDGDGVNGDN